MEQEHKLIEYIRIIYKLESSLYSQRTLYQDINNKIYYLNQVTLQPMHQLYSYPYDMGKFDFKSLMSYILGGGVIGTVVGAISGISLSWGHMFDNVGYNAAIGWITVSIIGAIIGLIILKKEQAKEIEDLNFYISENKRITQLNKEIEITNNRQIIEAHKKADLYKSELAKIDVLYAETEAVLKKYYELDIIYPKYRDFVAVSMFYEYFSSGRCATLPEAYNKYEDEKYKQLILYKLDEIIQRLDSIRDNQYMLYTAIQECNNNINNLSRTMEKSINSFKDDVNDKLGTISYYESINADNTEYLKMSKFFDSILK